MEWKAYKWYSIVVIVNDGKPSGTSILIYYISFIYVPLSPSLSLSFPSSCFPFFYTYIYICLHHFPTARASSDTFTTVPVNLIRLTFRGGITCFGFFNSFSLQLWPNDEMKQILYEKMSGRPMHDKTKMNT